MLYIYSNLLALFLYYVFCHLLFKKKKINGTVIFTIYFISFIIKYVINSFNSPQLNIIYSISLYFLIAFICYEDNFIYKTLLILGYFTLSIISESINFIIFNDFIKNFHRPSEPLVILSCFNSVFSESILWFRSHHFFD